MKGIKILVVFFFVIIGTTGFTKSAFNIADRNEVAYYLHIEGGLMEIDTRKTKTENGKSYYFASDGTPLTVNGEPLDLKTRIHSVLLSPAAKGKPDKKIEAEAPVAKKKGLFDYEKTASLADPREGQTAVDQSQPSAVAKDKAPAEPAPVKKVEYPVGLSFAQYKVLKQKELEAYYGKGDYANRIEEDWNRYQSETTEKKLTPEEKKMNAMTGAERTAYLAEKKRLDDEAWAKAHPGA